MSIKTPKFWLSRNIIAYFLLPFSFIYEAFANFFDLFCQERKVNKKVICIGNITLGGSGKTPIAIAIGKILQELDINFSYLSRGYLGKKNYFGYVEKNVSTSFDVGDEALILADIAPTFISKNKFLGAKEIARNNKIQAIILDDGMQNNLLKKDLTILVIDGKIKFGNKFLFPAGPLRQSVDEGLAKSDFIIVVGEVDQDLQKILATKKVFSAKIIAKNLSDFSAKKLVAFCGLAYPQKFFSFLENSGLEVIEKKYFKDHHHYKISELEELLKLAKKQNAKLVTTKKDWVKFPSNYKRKISYLDIDLELENKELVRYELQKLFKKY